MLLLLLIIEEWARLGYYDSNLDCILGRTPRIKETMSDFSLNHESRKGGTIGAI